MIEEVVLHEQSIGNTLKTIPLVRGWSLGDMMRRVRETSASARSALWTSGVIESNLRFEGSEVLRSEDTL